MSKSESMLDGRVTILLGDVRERLAAMEPDSVDCVVTSPPYWGLRDYGVAGQIGLERTLGEHLDVMIDVLRQVRRVLKPSGTLWLNYGDCYATSPNGRSAADTKAAGGDDRTFRDKPFSTIGGVLKPKDLCMVPNRLAIALQEDGWWVRSEIIWAKPNPMPESIRDRPATAHEKVFLLSKSGTTTCWRHSDGRWVWSRPEPDLRWIEKETGEVSAVPRVGENWRRVNLWAAHDYYYEAGAVRQGAAPASRERWAQDVDAQLGSYRANGGAKTNGTMKAVGGPRGRSTHGRHTLGDALPEAERRDKQAATAAASAADGRSSARRMDGFNARWDAKEKQRAADIASPRHAGGINHTGIEDVERGSRNLRNYEPAPLAVWPVATKPFAEAHFATFPPELAERCILAGCPQGGLVLDPFGGAGTTGLVAARHGRRAVMIELNPEYAEIARRRIEREWKVPQRAKDPDFGPLFGGTEAAE